MRHVSCDDLVKAVEKARRRDGRQWLAGSAEINEWFNDNDLDGITGFQDADRCEASKTYPRLLKFKEGPAQGAPVYFALSAPALANNEARTEAHGHGWLVERWDGENWVWDPA